jgi:hypothetical protein
MTRFTLAFLIALLPLHMADARSEEGALSLIRNPNNGQPAIVVCGDQFTIRAHGEPDVFVETGGRLIELTAQWRKRPGGHAEATVQIPPDFAPGLYSIVGILDEVEDTQQRALLILDSAPSQYTIAHIPSPGIASAQEASLAGAFEIQSPLFAIVTGDLTANGTADEYRTLLDWLNTSSIPTIVAPGQRDFDEGLYGEYFDSAPHMTQCGRDALLTIGEIAPQLDEDLSGESAAYQLLRRAMKPARWSIGISGYAHAALNPRMQIVLFVDTPLHVLVAGRADNVTEELSSVTWGSFQGATRILTPAADAPVGIQWIHVTPTGIADDQSLEEKNRE